MLSNILKGTLCVNPNWARPRHIPQTQWKCPLKIALDSDWNVAAGEESTEAVAQRSNTTDPRTSVPLYMASDNAESKTPVIPLSPIEVEEEGSLQNETSAAFLTTSSMKSVKQKEVLTSSTPVTHNFTSPELIKHTDVEGSGHSKLPAIGGDMMGIAMAGAAAALAAYTPRQDEQNSIDIGLLMQFLNNPDTVRNLISEQNVPGIDPAFKLNKPTPSIPFVSSNSDKTKLNTKDNCVPENTGAVISEPNASTSPVPFQSSRPKQGAIDIDLLARLLMNPKVIEKLIKEYDASDRSGSPSASMTIKAAVDQSSPAIATTPESSLSFPRANTVNEHSSPLISGVPFLPQKIVSSVFTASTKMSLVGEDLPYPEATMAPMSPLYSPPSASLGCDGMKNKRIIYEYGAADGMRMEPRSKTRLISPVVSFSLPQTELSELPRASMQRTTNVFQSLLQMSPLPPEVHPHPVLGLSAPMPMPGTKLMTSLGPDLSPRTELFRLPNANPQPAANMRLLSSVIGYPTPLMRAVAFPENRENCHSGRIGHGGTQRISDYDFVSLHGNTQVARQGLSMLQPQKPCIYFNSPRGCWNGTSCPYPHIKTDRSAPSQVEPSAKRIKLGWETSG